MAILTSDQRVVFVTGKGGVGKTSVAAALARAEADRGGAAVLVQLEGSEAAEQALGDQVDGVHVFTVTFLDALVGAISSIVHSDLLARLIVKQRALRDVARAIPALRELVALERIRTLAREAAPARVIVDLPATGHSIDWLRVPTAAKRFLRVGPAAAVCQRILSEVIDARRSAVVIVTTTEPIVANETLELCARVRSELGRDPALVVANRVPSHIGTEDARRVRAAASRGPAWSALADGVAARLARSLDAASSIGALRTIDGARVVEIPDLFRDPTPRELVGYLDERGTEP